jgi:predicted transcriptional regulator
MSSISRTQTAKNQNSRIHKHRTYFGIKHNFDVAMEAGMGVHDPKGTRT